MEQRRIRGKECRIFIDGKEMASNSPPTDLQPSGFECSFSVDLKPGSLDALWEALGKAPKAAAALTCLSCKTAEEFKGHPTIGEAMDQIKIFRIRHSACSAD